MEELSTKMSKRAKRRAKSQAKRAIRNLHPATKIAAVLFLLLGIAAGAFYTVRVSVNDRFELCGASAYSVDVGASFTYAEEGVEAVAFGRDVSGKLTVETTLEQDANGNYIIPTEKEGVYTITYTVDSFKFGEKSPNGVIKRIRVFTVEADEEDGKRGTE